MSALVASLMREQRAAEDRAIFDAYNNGGLYKGKPVDDKMILKYIAQRRDGFDSQDPLYDEWNNRLIQTKFIIGEQKVGLAYKQGRVGAGAVAAYYRNALKNIPRNSAFYRDVAGRAAEWAKGASRAARGRARGRATAPLRAKLNKQLEDQQGWLGLEAGMTAYARSKGLISGSQKLTDADASDLRDLFARGIYAGKDQITYGDFVRAARGYYKAIGAEIQTRLAMGNQAVEARKKRSSFLNDTLVRLNVMDEREQYEAARDTWMEARAAAGEDPYANAAADAAYAQALQGIYKNTKTNGSAYSDDPEFAGGLINEYDILTTGKSNGKTVSDIYDYSGPGSKDMIEQWGRMQDDIKLVETGKAYLGQSEPGGEIHVVQWQSGLGKDPLGLDDSLQPSISVVNGEKKLVYLKGQAVTASVILDENGEPVDTTSVDPATLLNNLRDQTWERQESKAPVGYVFTDAHGDVKYGVIDKTTGKMVFTEENPWSSDVTNVGGGLTVFGGAREDQRGNWRPDVNTVLDPNKAPPSLANSDPLLADSTVAPEDLMALAANGDLKLSDIDLANYKTRLAYQAASQSTYGSPDRVDERFRSNIAGTETDIEQMRLDRTQTPLSDQVKQLLGMDTARPDFASGKPPAVKQPPIITNKPPAPPKPPKDIGVEPPGGPGQYDENVPYQHQPKPIDTPVGDTPDPGTPVGGR